jgi:hypothetical protein
MPYGLEFLFFLGLAVVIITLLGHGIWVFLAFLFRGGQRKSKHCICVFCHKSISAADEFCYGCMRDLTSPLATEMTDLDAMLRQLNRFKYQGTLEIETVTNLIQRVKDYREQLLNPQSQLIATVVPESVAAKFSIAPQKEVPPEKPQPAISNPIVQAAIVSAKPQAEAIVPQAQVVTKLAAPSPSLPPKTPRKSWAEILIGFLAERNIRWTELIGVLVGGLLMVGCSIALVIAFWSQLESIPALKFLVFVGYSSAVFAAGLFVFHRWKLESTGRGLMLIATLLVPLNFVAMASFYKEQWGLQTWAMELISLGIFTWLVALAARALTPEVCWSTVLAVIGNSIVILLVARLFFEHSSPKWLIAAGCLPSLLLTSSVGSYLFFKPDQNKYNITAANSLFTLLGISIFCTAVALGLLTAQGVKSCSLSIAIHCLAIPLALAAISLLSAGLRVMRGMADDPVLEGYRTAGTTVALIGVVLQLASIIMAWPQPLLIIAVGVVGAVTLAYLALRHDFPTAHAGAMICLALAYLAGFYAIFDPGLRNLQSQALIIQSDTLSKNLLSMTISARSGTALGGLFLAFAAISEWLVLRGQKAHGKSYLVGAGMAAAVGLMLVTAHGFIGSHADAVRATILYASYGIVCILLSMRWRQLAILSYVGWNLLAFAPMWLIRSPAFDVWQSMAAMAGCLFWLAAIWGLLAWIHRKPVLFIAGQVVLIAANVLATLSWLEWQQWITSFPGDLYSPMNIQVFGIGLGLLSLAWMLIRLVSRPKAKDVGNQIEANNTVQRWFYCMAPNGNWRELLQTRPEIDKITTYFVVAAQFILAGGFLFYGCVQELATSAGGINPLQISTCGGCAWTLLGVLTLVIVAALWERWKKSELEICLLLAVSVPVLIADRFVNDLAVASAARWALAICFVACSSAVWGRKWLQGLGDRIHVRLEITESGPWTARGILVILTALPVLLITLEAALLQLGGHKLNGPLAKTFFDNIGPNISYLVPLALVMLGLIGHALRESSAGYAFGAGLVAEMAVILGYALHVTLASPTRSFQMEELIITVQLAVITAAVWALIWLIARRWVDAWREGIIETILMNVQIGMAILGNALLIGMAILEIFLAYGFQPKWAMHAGLPLGWCALLLTAGAGAYRRLQIQRHWEPHFVGLTGMAVLALLACTVPNIILPDSTSLDGIWAYRVLMLGWSIYALLVALATWWMATLRTLPDAQGPPQALIRLAAIWVRVAGIAAIILGLKAAFFHADYDNERLWAAAAIAIASTAGATMAVWRRREGWAFAAALGVNLAASLVVWHFEEASNLSFGQWWVRLVQANVIASSLVALFWLAAHKRLYALKEWNLTDSPLLAAQTALPVLGNVAILVLPVFSLIVNPQGLPSWMHDFSDPPGWLGLLLCTGAAAWYLYQTRAGTMLHVLGGLLLGAGVLITCTASGANISRHSDWLEYHLLFTSWAAAAMVVLGAAFAGKNLRLPAKNDPRLVLPITDRTFVFPKYLAATWVTVMGSLAVLLALLYCHEDLSGAWWRLRALVGLSLMAGIVALWVQSAGHVFVSGLLLNAAGTVAWIAWRPGGILVLVDINVLCLTGASIVWTLLHIIYPQNVPHFRLNNKALPFAHLALGSALSILGVLAPIVVTLDLMQLNHQVVTSLGWYALAATAAAAVLCIWDRTARLPLFGLYVLGLIALSMMWDYLQESPRMLCWRSGSDLAGFVLVAAIAGWLLPKARWICRRLWIPDDADRWAGQWFMQLQVLLVAAATALNVWIVLDFGFDGLGKGIALFGLSGRLSAITSVLMVLGASIVMAWQAKPSWRIQWQYAAFVVGLLFLSSLRWAGIDPASAGLWLHRSVVLLVSAAMMTLLCSFGLRKFIFSKSDWIIAGQRMAPFFGGLTILMLALVLGQEWMLYKDVTGTPLVTAEIVAVAVIVAAMLATCLAFAIRAEWDPLRLSLNGRQAYVYIAEVLAILIGLHLRLTKPELFNFGFIKNYWMLLIMGAAFAGAGLSEWFHRLKQPVLSIPLQRTALLLPLLPAIGFWFLEDPQSPLALVGRSPDVWFIMGTFYGLLAYTRRSLGCGLLAVLTANLGLWVALHQCDISFLHHPQLWLIPIAMAALAAEFLHHERLSITQSTFLRYFSLSVIYVSSTADMCIDMFMHGVEIDWRLPVVLMLLATAGAMAGLVLRIRSFLILGITFLMIDIIMMIWYAAVDLDQTWVWSASGIVLGVAIITFFVLFEKRRHDLLAAVQRFKEWER